MKYYSAILDVARVAGFDVLDDEARLRNTLGDLFPHDKDISVDNPLLQQAINENLSEWNDCREKWGYGLHYAILYLQPNQTTLSIYEGKRLVFSHSVGQGGVDIRKAVEDMFPNPNDYKEEIRRLYERYGSGIQYKMFRWEIDDVIITESKVRRVIFKRLDDIMSEFLPIFKGGDFAIHFCNVVIAGEGVGVIGIDKHIRDWVVEAKGFPVMTHFLSIRIAEQQEGTYIKNYYKGYEAE